MQERITVLVKGSLLAQKETGKGAVPMGRVKTLQTYNAPYERMEMQ